MINTVIRQIIDLDQKAIDIEQSALDEANKLERNTKQDLKSKETKVIEKAKQESKQNYATEIKKAEDKKETIIGETDASVKLTREKYDKVKQSHAKVVLEELFKNI